MIDSAITTQIEARAHRRTEEAFQTLLTTLRERGHRTRAQSNGLTLVDGIPVPILMRPADLGGRWNPTDRTWIQVGNVVFGHVWWATEPASGFDYEMLAGQIESFMAKRRRQLRRPS